MIETIEIETGLGSCGPTITIRISASDLVVLAKAMQGREYLDLCVTDGIRRIANIEMLEPKMLNIDANNPNAKTMFNVSATNVVTLEQ